MDKFKEALDKYYDNVEEIAKLTSLNEKYKASLPSLLNNHVLCFSTIPHLTGTAFQSAYRRFYQGKALVPFYTKQFIIFGIYDKQHILILQQGFNIRNYEAGSPSGWKISLAASNQISFEEDISKGRVYNYNDADVDFTTLSLAPIGTSTPSISSPIDTTIITSRDAIGQKPIKSILHDSNKETLNLITSIINPSVKISDSNREMMNQTLNDKTDDWVDRIIKHKIYDNPEDELSSDAKSICSGISAFMLNNDLTIETANTNTSRKSHKI